MIFRTDKKWQEVGLLREICYTICSWVIRLCLKKCLDSPNWLVDHTLVCFNCALCLSFLLLKKLLCQITNVQFALLHLLHSTLIRIPCVIVNIVNFKSRLSLIVRVNIVLNRTVIVDSDWRFDNLCGTSRRDVIGRLSVRPWCYWLWRLLISNWCVSIRLLS